MGGVDEGVSELKKGLEPLIQIRYLQLTSSLSL